MVKNLPGYKIQCHTTIHVSSMSRDTATENGATTKRHVRLVGRVIPISTIPLVLVGADLVVEADRCLVVGQCPVADLGRVHASVMPSVMLSAVPLVVRLPTACLAIEMAGSLHAAKSRVRFAHLGRR